MSQFDYFSKHRLGILGKFDMEKYEPIAHDVEEGQNYFWCSCGKSKKQPFCDGSHVGSEFQPLKYTAEKNETKNTIHCSKKRAERY